MLRLLWCPLIAHFLKLFSQETLARVKRLLPLTRMNVEGGVPSFRRPIFPEDVARNTRVSSWQHSRTSFCTTRIPTHSAGGTWH